MAGVVEEIKLRTDLVELISTYVPLKRSGNSHKGLCPFHGEKTPSFHVNGERGFFKCYGCGKGGDCFTFLMEKEGLSFSEAGELLARKLGLEWERKGESAEVRSARELLRDVNVLAQRFFQEALAAAPGAQQYLTSRGLSAETIEEFGLGYAPPGYEALLRWLGKQKISLELAEKADLVLQGERGWRDRFVDRIMFPIFDLEGRPIGFGGRIMQPDGIPKYLNSRETELFQKGRTLYGLNLAKREIPGMGFAVAVEGYMDLIALHQAGIKNVVASLGTAITEQHVALLSRYGKDGKPLQLVMCYDGDGAGIRAAERNAPMFEAARCEVRVASLPAGEDPDTYLQTRGAVALRDLLHRAESLVGYQLNKLRQRYNLSEERSRLPFIREAARIIAQSASHLDRQEYAARLTRELDRLADEWYPGEPQRALLARSTLSQEVQRLLKLDRMGHGRSRVAPPPAHQAERRSAERYVVRAMLSEPFWADGMAARFGEEHFVDPNLGPIVHAILGNTYHEDAVSAERGLGEEGEPASAAERAALVRADPASAELVSALLMEEAPLSDEGLEACAEDLERAWKTRRKQELLSAGRECPFPPGDPRGEELRGLLGDLGGRQRREA